LILRNARAPWKRDALITEEHNRYASRSVGCALQCGNRRALSTCKDQSMTKTIVIPVDVSHPEKAADMLDAAERLGGSDAKVVLLNVVEEFPGFMAAQLPAGYEERAREAALEELEKIAASTKLDSEIEVTNGYPSQRILAAAAERNADAIIIASHRPGFEDYLLGSTAARVVRHSRCTVVVLR
jgi:nucleotide-binding universal stress UspA family protein